MSTGSSCYCNIVTWWWTTLPCPSGEASRGNTAPQLSLKLIYVATDDESLEPNSHLYCSLLMGEGSARTNNVSWQYINKWAYQYHTIEMCRCRGGPNTPKNSGWGVRPTLQNVDLPCDLLLVLCDTWNWNDDNDTVSGIAILDTTAIPEMRIAQCNFNVVQNSLVSAVAFPLSIGCPFEILKQCQSRKTIPIETWTVSFFRYCCGWS